MEAVNPATGETIRSYPETSPREAAAAVEAGHEAFLSWRRLTVAERGRFLAGAAALLRERTGRYARLMSLEMGKPIREARAEVEKCAWVCDYFADHAAAMLQPERVRTDARASYVAFQPLGVVLAVMPWNFPFWQALRCAAPALAAGNAMVLKHASNVPGCALAVEEVLRDAGLPEGLFRTVLVGSSAVQALLEHPLVQAVSLTGSTAAGRAVGALAGRLLKKAVLELGGSDPYVVLEDADLEQAAATCVQSRLINTGQSCIAAKRLVVVRKVYQAFTEMVVQGMRSARMGDPLEEATQIGPLARADLREELHRQVTDSVSRGARLLLGGRIPDGPGAFYPPTVLSEVAPGMPAWQEELFGPVAALIPADGEAEALRAANDSPFGLGAALFTRDRERGERLAREELQAGNCFLNAFVRSDPRLPFGGVKDSGFGRELSRYGILEFVNIKTVYAE